MVILGRPIMTVKTLAPAAPFRWIRYTLAEYQDVLFKHKTGRAMPGYWCWTPKQLAEIREQHPDLSDEEFEQSYWVCEGGCMLCGSPLVNGSCSAPRTLWSLRLEDGPHLTRLGEAGYAFDGGGIVCSAAKTSRSSSDVDPLRPMMRRPGFVPIYP